MADVSVAIHEVLEDLRGTALDERDNGDKFERLVLNLQRCVADLSSDHIRLG